MPSNGDLALNPLKQPKPGQPNVGPQPSQNFAPAELPEEMVLVFEMVESEPDQEQLPRGEGNGPNPTRPLPEIALIMKPG